MESVNSRVTETAHVPLRALVRGTQVSDDSLRPFFPQSASPQLAKSAFTSAI